MRGLRRYVRSRLHRRIFLWFGATIAVTAALAGALSRLAGEGPSGFARSASGIERFAEGRFREVWDDPRARTELARSTAADLGLGVGLYDPAGQVIERHGPPCHGHTRRVTVAGRGAVELCAAHGPGVPGRFALGLLVAVTTLWVASGFLARRLTRPLQELSRVAREIGAGRLSSRVRLRTRHGDEVSDVAQAMNDMAARIERQLSDQKELLAAVSHELRTPLARLRVLTETLDARGALGSADTARLEREIADLDAIVGKLLASSRLDFSVLERRQVVAAEAAREALERAGVPADRLVDGSDGAAIEADPTLLARALANLLENAALHGGGVDELRITVEGARLRYAVADRGPGFAPEHAARAFEPFERGGTSLHPSSLGLGLSLVRRIAEAHGGRAFAEAREGGGARVVLELPRSDRAGGRGEAEAQ
ncbi:MAG: HAMP domain-containing histidine kinase [Deltaproteobacteria bacterium]|nr:HAMP domain-containing histidine kinase [Deltaproteobacteria bacterium]